MVLHPMSRKSTSYLVPATIATFLVLAYNIYAAKNHALGYAFISFCVFLAACIRDRSEAAMESLRNFDRHLLMWPCFAFLWTLIFTVISHYVGKSVLIAVPVSSGFVLGTLFPAFVQHLRGKD